MTGSVRGALSNERPYRDRAFPISPRVIKPRAPCPRGGPGCYPRGQNRKQARRVWRRLQ